MNVITRAFSGAQDLENFVVPAMGALAGLIRYHDGDDRSKEVMELGTNILANVCDAVTKFADSRPENAAKMRFFIEKIAPESLLDNLFEMIFVAANSPNYSALSARTWSNIMLVLRYMCRYSPKVCRHCVSNGVLSALQNMLSGEKSAARILHLDSKYPRVGQETVDVGESAILLLDAILPHKYLLNMMGKCGEIADFEQYSMEAEKEKIFLDQGSAVQMLGEAVFPRIVGVYEGSVSASTRFYCLQIIDKLCYLCDPAAIAKIMPPQPAAQFIYDNLSSSEPLFVCFGLRIAELVMQKLVRYQKLYLRLLKREGVLGQLRQLQDYPYLDRKYCQQLQESAWCSLESPYVQHFLSFRSAEAPNMEQQPPVAEQTTFYRGGLRSVSGTLSPPYGRRLIQALPRPEKPFSAKLVDYMYTKSGQILGEHVNKASANCPELKLAEEEFVSFQKTVSHLETLLRLGAAGRRDEWAGLFQRLADLLLAGDSSFTGYEARCTRLVENLFSALCVMPCDYSKQAAAESSGEEVKAGNPEVRIRNFVATQRADLEQMVMRHNVFMNAMSRTQMGSKSNRYLIRAIGTAMEELIKRLGELLAHTEKCVDETAPTAEQLAMACTVFGLRPFRSDVQIREEAEAGGAVQPLRRDYAPRSAQEVPHPVVDAPGADQEVLRLQRAARHARAVREHALALSGR